MCIGVIKLSALLDYTPPKGCRYAVARGQYEKHHNLCNVPLQPIWSARTPVDRLIYV